MGHKYDTIVIGGGFYGLRIAQFLVDELGQKRVLVLEKGDGVMKRASYNNQARVHNGYHYPRSILTALRSRVNLPVFSQEYQEAIVNDFEKIYGVARSLSKVSARQFQRFYERIGAEIEPSKQAMEYFDPRMIEQAFVVKEFAFNSSVLKNILLTKLAERNIIIHTQESVEKIESLPNGIRVHSSRATYEARKVLNTTYAALNIINVNSALPPLPLKHELTEMCLVSLPESLSNKAITIMCGPFFSLMPFPDKGLYTMSHVRYTPHREWHDDNGVEDRYRYVDQDRPVSNFPAMYADIKRYMPEAKNIKYSGESLWELKTVLTESEGDDSRPILYKPDYGGIKNYICIMGGKIDNVYDVFRELRESYA